MLLRRAQLSVALHRSSPPAAEAHEKNCGCRSELNRAAHAAVQGVRLRENQVRITGRGYVTHSSGGPTTFPCRELRLDSLFGLFPDIRKDPVVALQNVLRMIFCMSFFG